MLCHSIVVKHHSLVLPTGSEMQVGRSFNVSKEHLENSVTFLFLQTDDFAHVFSTDKKCFAASGGVFADDGMDSVDAFSAGLQSIAR